MTQSIKSISIAIPPQQMQRLSSIPGVKAVKPVAAHTPEEFIFRPADSPPNDTSPYGYSRQQLSQINIIPLQQAGYLGEGVIIGVLDTGFRLTDLAFVFMLTLGIVRNLGTATGEPSHSHKDTAIRNHSFDNTPQVR